MHTGPFFQYCMKREVVINVKILASILIFTCSLREWLDSCLEVCMSRGEVMLVVTVIHDKGHVLAGRMDGKDIS